MPKLIQPGSAEPATPITATIDTTTQVDLSRLSWHEACDPEHLQELIDQLRCETVREPIHVALHDDIILDGAHRSKASQLLGRLDVPAHLVPMPADTRLPGWTHVLPEDGPRPQSPSSTGPVIARVQDGDEQVDLRATARTAYEMWRSYWQVADEYRHHDYSRSATEDVDADAVTWLMPTWGEVVRLVTEFGPLPPGITRLAPVFAKLCPVCS